MKSKISYEEVERDLTDLRSVLGNIGGKL